MGSAVQSLSEALGAVGRAVSDIVLFCHPEAVSPPKAKAVILKAEGLKNLGLKTLQRQTRFFAGAQNDNQ